MATGTKGNCYICGAELGKTAMKNHIIKVHGEEDGSQDCRLLKIEGAHCKDYWLFIDIPADTSLHEVDDFLRKIWLECCGHMSAFRTSGLREVTKNRYLNNFTKGDKIMHEYDFGTTTETLITIVGAVKRKPQKEIVRLLARNVPPQFKCDICGLAAEYICTECVYESDNPFYCKKCSDKHKH